MGFTSTSYMSINRHVSTSICCHRTIPTILSYQPYSYTVILPNPLWEESK